MLATMLATISTELYQLPRTYISYPPAVKTCILSDGDRVPSRAPGFVPSQNDIVGDGKMSYSSQSLVCGLQGTLQLIF